MSKPGLLSVNAATRLANWTRRDEKKKTVKNDAYTKGISEDGF